MLHILREHFDIQSQGGSGDLAVGPIYPVRKTKLAVEIGRGQAVGFIGQGETEGLQERIDQTLFAFVTGTGKQFGNDQQMCTRATYGGLRGKECDGIRSAPQTVD